MRPSSGLTTRRFADEMKEAAVQRFLTSDLSLTAVAEQFGTTRYSVANWIKLAHSRGDVKKHKQHVVAAATPTDHRSASEKLRLLIEAGSLGEEQLGEFLRREGLHDGDLERFRAALVSGNHTLKRALTDPRLISGIGNAYSDEILHAAQLSPLSLTQKLEPLEWERLFAATRQTVGLWVEQLCAEAQTGFPEKVTAFRPGMAVHGRYGQPCPRCGDKVLRIRYADKETNYCARCQTGGRVLADRSLSRLLGKDWPRTLEELEALKRR